MSSFRIGDYLPVTCQPCMAALHAIADAPQAAFKRQVMAESRLLKSDIFCEIAHAMS
jgi:hypothetical protein